MKKITLLLLLAVVALWATADVNTITIKPEYMKPGIDLDVNFLMKKVIDNVNQIKPVKMVAVISEDDVWSDDDMLFLYKDAKGSEPLTSVDKTKQVFKLTKSEWFEGWFVYTWPTKVPTIFMHGQKKFIIVRIAEGDPNWDTNNTIAKMDGKWQKELAIEFEVAENKAVIYNTAYVEDKSDTAKFIISKGLPDAFLEASPPGNGIAGIGTETVFDTETLGVSITTTDKVGALIYYTIGNAPVVVGDSDQLYDSTKGITIDGTDTLRAVAVVPGFKNREAVWYYTQDLPDVTLFAAPSIDTPLVYTFTTTTLSVTLGLVTEDGDTLLPSDDVKIYYTRGNTKPKIGDVNTKEYLVNEKVVITSSDTIRAIAVVKGYDTPAEGVWCYAQDLPEAYVFATPSVDTPTVYGFTTASLSVNLGIVGRGGDTLQLSDSVELYYTKGNSKPVIGGAGTIKLTVGEIVTLTSSDTIRALAIVKGYDPVPEGVWYYEQNLPVAMLKAEPGSDTVYTYDTPTLQVKLSTDPGNVIYYTQDGSEPDFNSKQIDSSEGWITVVGDDTVKAFAYGDGYIRKDSLWIYESELPPLYLEAEAGLTSSTDTLGFFFDTTVALRAVDSLGNEVSGAKIYYLVDSGEGLTVDTVDALYMTPFTIDSTVTVRAIAYHDMYQAADGVWHYKLLEVESWLHAYTSDSSYLGDSLIFGDSIMSPNDTAHFGHNLRIVLESNSDSVSYSFGGGDYIYTEGDTITLSDDDPDTVYIEAQCWGHGYSDLSQMLVFVRDTVAVLSVDPIGHTFVTSTKVVLALDKEWRNQTIWFDTSGSGFELYEKPIALDTTKSVIAQARADFAVESKILREEYLQANGVKEAYYLDRDANGSIDAATLLFTRDIEELPDAVHLISPFDRNEVQVVALSQMQKVESRQLLVSFSEAFVFTDNTAFEAGRYGLLQGAAFVEDSFAVADSVAPVVVSALYEPGEIISIDPVVREADELSVTLSEPVTFGDAVAPFELKRGAGHLYTLSLDETNLSGTRANFIVEGIHGVSYPEKEDSIHISVDAKVADAGDVKQVSEANRFVPLVVKDIPYKLLVQAIAPVVPWEYEIPDALKGEVYESENGLLIVADFLMKMESEAQDASVVLCDKVGNVVARCSGRDDSSEDLSVEVISEETTKVVIYWSGKNLFRRRVGSGRYIAQLLISDGRNGSVPHKAQVSIGVAVSK